MSEEFTLGINEMDGMGVVGLFVEGAAENTISMVAARLLARYDMCLSVIEMYEDCSEEDAVDLQAKRMLLADLADNVLGKSGTGFRRDIFLYDDDNDSTMIVRDAAFQVFQDQDYQEREMCATVRLNGSTGFEDECTDWDEEFSVIWNPADEELDTDNRYFCRIFSFGQVETEIELKRSDILPLMEKWLDMVLNGFISG